MCEYDAVYKWNLFILSILKSMPSYVMAKKQVVDREVITLFHFKVKKLEKWLTYYNNEVILFIVIILPKTVGVIV